MVSVDNPQLSKLDPVLQNTLRYTISAKEYQTLHEYLINRSPRAIRRRAPQPSNYAAFFKGKDEYNAATVRASLRIFLATQAGLKIWDLVNTHILRRGKSPKYVELVCLLVLSTSNSHTEANPESPSWVRQIFDSPYPSP